MAKEPVDLRTRILTRLETAGASGLAASKIPDAGKQRSAVLASLLQDRKIGNLGSDAKPRFVLIEHFNPLELAAAHIESKATPGKAVAYTLSKLEAGSGGAVKQQIRKAIDVLVNEGVLIRLALGKTAYWLHTASIRPLIPGAAPEAAEDRTDSAALPSPSEEDRHAAIAAAYARAKLSEGFSDVLISNVLNESGLPLAVLHQMLLEYSRSGKAVLSFGDLSVTSEEHRAAALILDGKHYLRIRLLD